MVWNGVGPIGIRYSRMAGAHLPANQVAVVPVQRKLNKVQRKQVKKIAIGILEHEAVYTDQTVVPVAGTPGVLRLSGSVQGDADGNRQGNEIKIIKFEFNIGLQVSTAQTSQLTHVRLIIFHDNEQAGVVPTGAQLLQNYTAGIEDYMRFKNIITTNPTRFRFIMDRHYTLSTPNLHETAAGSFTANAVAGSDRVIRKVYNWKKNPRRIRYIGTTNAQASDGKGSIYLFAFTNVTTNGPNVDCHSQITFLDA